VTAATLERPLVAETVPDAADPTRRLGRFRLTQVAICLAIVALPLLRPSGPGNTGMVDLALLVAMFASAMWASLRSQRLRLPYALPMGLTMLAGAIAVAAGGASSGAAGRGLLAIGQDVFVLGWAAAVATLGRDPKLLDMLCRAWAYSAAGWAAVLIIGELAGISAITGISARDGIRASLTLGDPNLAANYFLCGLLVIRATRRPRRRGLRVFMCALVVTGVILTLSNGGILAMLIATVAGALFRIATRRGLLPALAAGLVLVGLAGATLAAFDVHTWVTRVEQTTPFIRDSIGRQAESGGSRSMLLREGVKLWLHGETILGVGPGNTETTLRARQAPYVKEAHDDYLAALLERGLLGGIALVLLATGLAVRTRRICRPGGVDPPYLDVVPRPELLAAAVVAVAVSGMLYETLHFRHVWALFGLIAALEAGRERT
jgi:O-antigen ligase